MLCAERLTKSNALVRSRLEEERDDSLRLGLNTNDCIQSKWLSKWGRIRAKYENVTHGFKGENGQNKPWWRVSLQRIEDDSLTPQWRILRHRSKVAQYQIVKTVAMPIDSAATLNARTCQECPVHESYIWYNWSTWLPNLPKATYQPSDLRHLSAHRAPS